MLMACTQMSFFSKAADDEPGKVLADTPVSQELVVNRQTRLPNDIIGDQPGQILLQQKDGFLLLLLQYNEMLSDVVAPEP